MKRFLSLILAVIMTVSALCVGTFAAPSGQCMQFSASGAYFLSTTLEIEENNTVISFDLAMAPNSSGEPCIKINDSASNGVAIASNYVEVAGAKKSFGWGDCRSNHWRHIEIKYFDGAAILKIDGTEIMRAPASCRTGSVYMIGSPGNILIDDLSFVSGGISRMNIDFENDSTYNYFVTSDSTVTRTAVPSGSYCDYDGYKIQNREYVFDGTDKCNMLTLSSGTKILLGDLSGDRKLNGRDTIILRNAVAGALTNYDKTAADVNQDGRVNSRDVILLRNCVAGSAPAKYLSTGTAGTVAYSSSQRAAVLTASDATSAGIDAVMSFDKSVLTSDYSYAVITYMVPSSSTEKNSSAAVESGFGSSSEIKSFSLARDGKFHSELIGISEISSWNQKSATYRFFSQASAGDRIYLDSVIFCPDQETAVAVIAQRSESKRSYGVYDKAASGALATVDKDGNAAIRFDTQSKITTYVVNGNDSNVSYAADSNGKMSLVATCATGVDPSIYIDLSTAGISADTYKSVTYVYNIPTRAGVSAPTANIYYVCGGIAGPTGGYETQVAQLTKDGKYHYFTFDLSSKSNWSGKVTGLRLDYFGAASAYDSAYIDSVIFSKDAISGAAVGQTRVNERNAFTSSVSTASDVWNDYRTNHKLANTDEFIATGSAGNDYYMYFRYSSKAKLTARSLGDKMARAIKNATGYHVGCEVYSGLTDLLAKWDDQVPQADVMFTITYLGNSYTVWVNTSILKTSGHSDLLDGTEDDEDVTPKSTSTWYTGGVSGTDSAALPAASSGLSAHSNHENRLVETPYGTFAVIPMTDNGSWATLGGAQFTIYRIYDNGSYKALGTYDFANHTSKPNIYYMDGRVYVIQGDDQGSYASIFVAYFDPSSPNSDGSYNITSGRTNKSYSGGAAPGGNGYIQPMPDPANHRFIVMACGGTSTGYLSWFIYNTSSNSWTGTAKKVALNGTYRHCYLMSYPDGKNGLYIVAGRDVLLSTLGLSGTVTGADYAWDEVNLFHFPDMNSTSYTMTHVAVADYTQKDRMLFPVTSHNIYGDMFLDSAGYLHVLSSTVMHGSFHHDNKYSQMNYAVYDARQAGMTPVEIFNKAINFNTPATRYTARFAENTSGKLFILAMPKDGSYCEIWRASDCIGTEFEMIGCDKFSSSDGVTTGLIIGNSRNGSVCDNSVSCMYPTSGSGGTVYRFFTVNLPN